MPSFLIWPLQLGNYKNYDVIQPSFCTDATAAQEPKTSIVRFFLTIPVESVRFASILPRLKALIDSI